MPMYIGPFVMVEIYILLQLYLSKLSYMACLFLPGVVVPDSRRLDLYLRGLAA